MKRKKERKYPYIWIIFIIRARVSNCVWLLLPWSSVHEPSQLLLFFSTLPFLFLLQILFIFIFIPNSTPSTSHLLSFNLLFIIKLLLPSLSQLLLLLQLNFSQKMTVFLLNWRSLKQRNPIPEYVLLFLLFFILFPDFHFVIWK